MRLYDDRLDLFIGGTKLMTLPGGRSMNNGNHGHVVDYHHVIHSLRRKANSADKAGLPKSDLPARTLSANLQAAGRSVARARCLPADGPPARLGACACEAELADLLAEDAAADRLPNMAALMARFAPDPATLPEVVVELVPLGVYDALLIGEAAWL